MKQVHKMKFLFTIFATLVYLSVKFLPCASQSVITSGNETDRFALLAFKDRITSDPFGVLTSWNDSSHYCTWIGVVCSRRHPSRVTVLNLRSMGLTGPISPHIGNLTFLQNLRLSNNSFNGEIPQEVGRLFRLQFLYLTNNSLQGEIPNNLTSCTKLIYLFLTGNQLTGKLPAQLGSLSKLVVFELSLNYFDGSIPASLSNMSALTVLSLSSSNLYGNIPSEIDKLSRLEFFQVSGNNLSGTIPAQLFNISSIYLFAVAGNQLHGSIPPNVGNTLPNLRTLTLGGNMFSGLLPTSISNVSRLSQVDFSRNQFRGHVPPNLGSLQDLVRLSLGENQLGTGEADDLNFFTSLSNCSHLEVLALTGNNLSGQLPDSIANLSTKLTKLYIGGNRIFGEITPGIENLVSLNGLAMENNLLTGSIPVFTGKLPNLVIVAMSGNQLSGKIPSNICNSTRLEEIYFDRNRLQDQIPPSLGNCPKLRVLNLAQNQLTDTIPDQIIGLSALSVKLDLSWNLLTGNLSSEVGNMAKIINLDLSNNQLSGIIPSSLGKCIGLESLYLRGNFFEGIIPPSLESLKGLKNIDLSSNRLSGHIPKYLEYFVSLKYLNLSFNDFEGEVPKQGIFENISAISILGNDKLCGGIALLHLPSCPRPASKKQSKQFPLKRLLLIIFGVVIFVIILGVLFIFIWRMRARKKPSSDESPFSDMFQKISYKELLKATDGFSAENLVGAGSYGSVYKGLLVLSRETTTVVAVKVLDLQRRGASKSFTAECEALRCIRHRNLVKILTSCSSVDFKGNEFKALVLEFMSNGSLENWLHPIENDKQRQGSTRKSLSFMERLNIAIDVASALDYLHHHCQVPIVHCDLKPSNILLDDNTNGHVSDFGLAKFLGGVAISAESEYHTTSASVGIRGAVGYAAPEYGMGREVSTNGDVYSYGILLLEMFTGRRPTDDMFKDGLSLHTFARTSLLANQVMHIIDPKILLVPLHLQGNDASNNDDYNKEEELISGEMAAKVCEALTGIIRLGVTCSVDTPKERMEMLQVVKELQSIKSIYISV